MSDPTVPCAPAWVCKPLVVHVQEKLPGVPSLLRLVPVFFNPLALGDLDFGSSDEGAVVGGSNEVPMKPEKSVVKERKGPQRAASFETRAEKYEGTWIGQYFNRKKKVLSEYMDDHKISSLLRTFEIMSRHEERCGSPITLTWQNGKKGYVGIINNKGDVALSCHGLKGMEKVVVDPVDNVVMLHSTMWDQCITGHIDRSIVDGKADSSDITACHWKVIPCQTAFPDATCDPHHVVLQFYGKQHTKDTIQNGMFFVITGDDEFKLEKFRSVKDHGIFLLQ